MRLICEREKTVLNRQIVVDAADAEDDATLHTALNCLVLLSFSLSAVHLPFTSLRTDLRTQFTCGRRGGSLIALLN